MTGNKFGKLFGEKDLTPAQRKMYHEIMEEGHETYPALVAKGYPDKDKCYLKFGYQNTERKHKSTKIKSKGKKKKDCGCK